MTNKYPGNCFKCAKHVAAHQGKLIKLDGKWVVSHFDDECNTENTPMPTFKERHGHCEDAPCCGCCGGGNEYLSAEYFHDGGYNY